MNIEKSLNLSSTVDSSKRIIALDLLKTIACICVILLHSLRHFDKTVDGFSFLYYFCRIAIPIFFMVTGFLQLNRKNCSYKYCFKKIVKIILIVSFWVLIFDVVLTFARHTPFPFKDIFLCYFQKGNFGIFWFFGTLIIIYLLLPIFGKIFKKDQLPIILTFVLAIICVTVHILSTIYAYKNNKFLQAFIPQTLRLWTWFFYLLLGGCIKKYKLSEKFKTITLPLFLSVLFSVLSVFNQFRLFKIVTNVVNSEYYYDSPVLMLCVFFTFILMMKIKYHHSTIIITQFVSSNFLGVYIFHLMVIRVVGSVVGSIGKAGEIALIIGIIIVTFAASSIASRIPYIKNLLKL